MVIFDQLRLSDDAQKMFINVHVNTAAYFARMYIKRLVIVTSDKVTEASCKHKYPTDANGKPVDYIYMKEFEDYTKEVDLVLTVNDFIKTWETEVSRMNFKREEMSKTLFFVYVECEGIVASDTPCTMDEPVSVGVTFDEKLLYQKTMGYVKDLADECKVPSAFANFILLWYAFKAAVVTEHFIDAIKYWKWLFDEYSTEGVTTKGCGCHG